MAFYVIFISRFGELGCKWAAIKWTKCTKSCGGGRRTGIRRQTGGKSCTRTRRYRGWCNRKRCCQWGKLKWTKCSNSKGCGRGRRTGVRKQSGGKTCTRTLRYRRGCNLKRCKPKCVNKWEKIKWTKCSAACGRGLRTGVRQRKCGSKVTGTRRYRRSCYTRCKGIHKLIMLHSSYSKIKNGSNIIDRNLIIVIFIFFSTSKY